MGEATTTLPLRCNPFPLDGGRWDGGEIPALTKLLAGVTPIPRFAGTSPVKGEEFAYPCQPIGGGGDFRDRLLVYHHRGRVVEAGAPVGVPFAIVGSFTQKLLTVATAALMCQ